MPYRTQEDRIDGVVITFVEITLAKMPEMKLRKSETELASLIDSAPQIIVSLSADGTILEFNREAERVFGQNREHAIGRNYFELFVPEPAWQEVSDGMFRALSGSPVRGLETPALVCGGSTAQILWSINSILDPDGGVIGVIAMGHPHASP
jgi:PAS domain S-box-containing protein